MNEGRHDKWGIYWNVLMVGGPWDERRLWETNLVPPEDGRVDIAADGGTYMIRGFADGYAEHVFEWVPEP
jgi:hypothetical protein